VFTHVGFQLLSKPVSEKRSRCAGARAFGSPNPLGKSRARARCACKPVLNGRSMAVLAVICHWRRKRRGDKSFRNPVID
jgi:hypothetical protein